MDGDAFKVFIEKCLVPQLWSGAVVVMDNLPAHKIAVLNLCSKLSVQRCLICRPIPQILTQLNARWSQLKAFLRQFSPTTTKMVDILTATALDLINPQHLQNWLTKCCYCTS
jgi:hypothetical protein